MSNTNPKRDVTRDDGACMKPGCTKCGALPADQGKHRWDINITCPRCRHVGNAAVAFDCCDCSAGLAARVASLEAALRMLVEATIQLAPYPPETVEAVLAIVDIAHTLLSPRDGEAK